MSKKYIPEGSWLACNKGTCPSSFRISNNNNTKIYGSNLASEADLLPFLNIKPMGICSVSRAACIPAVLKWDDPQDGVTVNNFRLLNEDSTCKCSLGGKIKIHFDRNSAAVDCIAGKIKMPTEYIKEGFDWMAEQNAKSREARDSDLPDWMKSVTHVTDWFGDITTGLVEGAVNGVVGMGEGIYQIAQDPVGTAEAVGGMLGDGYNKAKEGLTNAEEWASDVENWSNAYNSTKVWVSESDNWKDAANSAWESTKDAGDWVAKNPRKIGTSVGQFIPDVALAVYTAGASEAATGARLATREAAKLTEEAVARQLAKETAERLAKEEAARLGEKALVREVKEEVGEVVVKSEKELAEEAVDAKRKFDADKATNKQKGNFGEMSSKDNLLNNPELKKKGYDLKRIGDDAPTGLDDKIKQGIDGIYENKTPPPKFVIDEAKFGKSELSQKPKDGPQMSDDWIKGSKRLEKQVGPDKAREIEKALKNKEVERVLSKVDAEGNVRTYKLGPDGKVIGPWP